MYYLIEPYSHFQGKKTEKHWMQIAEEEMMFHKYLMEQQRIHQQQQQQILEATPNAAGQPERGYFNPNLSINFTISPAPTGSAPYTVYLNNASSLDLMRFANFTWNFSDGTSLSGVNVTKTFNTGSFNISLTASGLFNGQSPTIVIPNAITASLPVITANFTSSVKSGSIPLTVNFINTSTINQYTGSTLPGVSYLWNFGNGFGTSTDTNPTVIYTQTGSYTVKLEATGSYGMKNSKQLLYISASL